MYLLGSVCASVGKPQYLAVDCRGTFGVSNPADSLEGAKVSGDTKGGHLGIFGNSFTRGFDNSLLYKLQITLQCKKKHQFPPETSYPITWSPSSSKSESNEIVFIFP